VRTYTVVTGLIFALLLAVHVARAVVEGLHVLREPFFAGSTLVAAGLSVWAFRLLRRK
jgi:hypothetical protein